MRILRRAIVSHKLDLTLFTPKDVIINKIIKQYPVDKKFIEEKKYFENAMFYRLTKGGIGVEEYIRNTYDKNT